MVDESSLSYYLIVVLLFLSAFFSASETAFFSLSKIHVKKLEKAKDPSQRRIFRLLKKPNDLLITILLGNTIVNIAASSAAALIAVRLSSHFHSSLLKDILVAVEVVVMTLIILIFGEITPKLFAIAKAEKIAAFAGLFIEFLKYAFYPVIKILNFFSWSITHGNRHNQALQNSDVTGEDFHNLISSENNLHPLDENEKKIIEGIFRFSEIHASEIMVPRVDMIAVDLTSSMQKVTEKIITSGHSRIPVYKNSVDDIVGFVYAKDLILNREKKSVSALLRRPCYIPENITIQALLNQFRARKTHLAIVVDEYGGTSGMVTLEDILETLVGEINDEYDNEMPVFTRLSDSEYSVSGMCPVSDLNLMLGLDIDEDKHDNLASFLYDEFNRVPGVNDHLTYHRKALFTVTQVKKQRIQYARVKIIEETE